MAVYTVSGGGDALKIQLNSAPDNSVILVEPGVYTPLNPGGTTKNVQVIGMDKDTCIIDGGGTSCLYDGRENYGSTKSNIKLYNFTLRNGTNDRQGRNHDQNNIHAVLYGGTYINCNFHHLIATQRYYTDSSTGNLKRSWIEAVTFRPLMYGCEIHDCSSDTHWDFQPVVQYNLYIHDNVHKTLTTAESEDGTMVNLDGQAMYYNMRNGILVNNVLCGCVEGGMQNCIIANNISCSAEDRIYSSYRGNTLCYRGGSVVRKNNVYYNNKEFNSFSSFNAQGSTTQMHWANCVFVQNNAYNGGNANKTAYITLGHQGSLKHCWLDGTHTISMSDHGDRAKRVVQCITDGTDPGFVDPANNDFHLKPNSPLIAMGEPSLLYSINDLAGRPFKDPPAIGPYEFYEDGAKLGWKMPNYMVPFGGFSPLGDVH